MQEYDEGKKTQATVAKQFRVSEQLVFKLVKESVKKPEKLRELKQKEKDIERGHQAVEDVVSFQLERSIPIEKARQVQDQVEKRHGIAMSNAKVRQSMKKELGLEGAEPPAAPEVSPRSAHPSGQRHFEAATCKAVI